MSEDLPEAEATFDFAARKPTELTLHRGDVVQLLSTERQWWEGRLKADPQRKGRFPSNYVVPIAAASERRESARATFDFAARGPTELSLAKGAALVVVARDPAKRWWKAEAAGRRGLVPSTHVQLLLPPHEDAQQRPSLPPPAETAADGGIAPPPPLAPVQKPAKAVSGDIPPPAPPRDSHKAAAEEEGDENGPRTAVDVPPPPVPAQKRAAVVSSGSIPPPPAPPRDPHKAADVPPPPAPVQKPAKAASGDIPPPPAPPRDSHKAAAEEEGDENGPRTAVDVPPPPVPSQKRAAVVSSGSIPPPPAPPRDPHKVASEDEDEYGSGAVGVPPPPVPRSMPTQKPAAADADDYGSEQGDAQQPPPVPRLPPSLSSSASSSPAASPKLPLRSPRPGIAVPSSLSSPSLSQEISPPLPSLPEDAVPPPPVPRTPRAPAHAVPSPLQEASPPLPAIPDEAIPPPPLSAPSKSALTPVEVLPPPPPLAQPSKSPTPRSGSPMVVNAPPPPLPARDKTLAQLAALPRRGSDEGPPQPPLPDRVPRIASMPRLSPRVAQSSSTTQLPDGIPPPPSPPPPVSDSGDTPPQTRAQKRLSADLTHAPIALAPPPAPHRTRSTTEAMPLTQTLRRGVMPHSGLRRDSSGDSLSSADDIPPPPLPPDVEYYPFEEPASDANFRVKQSTGELLGASSDKLIAWLTAASSANVKEMKYFALTYRMHFTPDGLFAALRSRYAIPKSVTVVDPDAVKLNTLSVLREWVEYAASDFLTNRRLLESVRALVSAIAADPTTPQKVRILAQQLPQLINLHHCEAAAIAAAASLSTPQVGDRKLIKPILIIEVPPDELARQVTLLDFDVLQRISPVECLRKAWSGADAAERAPNIVRFTEMFNNKSHWAEQSILAADNVKDRSKLIKYFIAVAKACLEIGNFNGMMVFLSAVQSRCISRLKKPWNEKKRKEVEQLSSFIESNYRELRRLQGVTSPSVPYLGMFLSDLTFIEDGNPDFMPDTKLINYVKMKLAASVIEKLQAAQRKGFNFTPIPNLCSILRNLTSKMTDNQSYELSLQIEPRESHS